FVSLSWNNQLPIRVAIARGFFKDQGLALEPIFVRGGPVAITALISGNVDFASVGGAQAPIRSNARGLDLHIIASLSNYTNYTLLGSKDAKNVEDLRGKVIGVTGAGAFSDFAIRIYLKRNNLDPDKDATLRAIGPTALRAVALEKGLIAAAPFSAEDTIRLLDKGFPMIVNLNEALFESRHPRHAIRQAEQTGSDQDRLWRGSQRRTRRGQSFLRPFQPRLGHRSLRRPRRHPDHARRRHPRRRRR